MIKIIPDNVRYAILRGGRFQRLLGPGIVIQLPRPGQRNVRLSIGDAGTRVSDDIASFHGVSLPVVRKDASDAGKVVIEGFEGDTILVSAAEDTQDT